MSQDIRTSFPTFAKMLSLYCHANTHDPAAFERQVNVPKWKELNPTFRDDFQNIVENRLISIDEFANITDIEFDSDDELYSHLKGVFSQVYHEETPS